MHFLLDGKQYMIALANCHISVSFTRGPKECKISMRGRDLPNYIIALIII